MKILLGFRRMLPLVVAAAMIVGVNGTLFSAAPKKADEAAAAKTEKATTTAALVDINTATAAQLEDVPGIGPSYAKKIIAARPFAAVADLSKTGIPAARLQKFIPLVTVGAKAAAIPMPAAARSGPKPKATAESTTKTVVTPATTAKPEATAKPAAGLVDLNTATAAQLEEISGVGPAYAKKIIAARPYATVQELSKSGIPAARLGKIMPMVAVAAKAEEKPVEKTVAKTTDKTVKPADKTMTAAGSSDKVATTPATDKAVKPATKSAPVEARTPPTKGMVWANSDTKVYHTEGDHWYGRTKKGEWMTEADAVKAGYRKSK